MRSGEEHDCERNETENNLHSFEDFLPENGYFDIFFELGVESKVSGHIFQDIPPGEMFPKHPVHFYISDVPVCEMFLQVNGLLIFFGVEHLDHGETIQKNSKSF